MQLVQKYEVVTAMSLKDMIETVNIKIQEGWQPIGGIAFALNPTASGMPKQSSGVYAQALAR
jgi:hypothetical protein